jgi:hypothetical protein
MEGRVRRLRQGRTLQSIINYLIDSHPAGMKRSDLQDRLKAELGVGESTGGVNRQLKKLRQSALIDWDQAAYTYILPPDHDSKEYFLRLADTLNMSTDQAYFMSSRLKRIISPKTVTDIDDYLGFRYDEEMNENIMALHNDYKLNEIRVHDTIAKLQAHHNSYVRLRLFKTANECFLRDLAQLDESNDPTPLLRSYTNNLKSAHLTMERETGNIFRLREELIKHLNEKRLSRRMKFLIRYALNNVRPSHIYDGLL